jgi:hypothetical protein
MQQQSSETNGRIAPAQPDQPDPERASWVFRVGMAIGMALVVVLVARLVRMLGPCLASAVSGV